MSRSLQNDCEAGHRALLDLLDAQVRRTAGADAAVDAAARLRHAQVFLVAGGAVGLRTAVHLAGLGLRHLTICPLSAKDLGIFQAPLRASGHANWSVFPHDFNIYGAAMQLKLHQLLAFAASMPAPRVQRELNEAAVRLDIPLVQASVFAHEVYLGPTVLPGHTACNACYQTRLKANYGRVDVPEARDRFLDKNPEFEFRGQLDAIDRLAAALAASEAERLLGGARPPLALSREVVVNALTQGRQDSFVPYVEWCAVCSSSRPRRSDDRFARFVRETAAAVRQPLQA